MRRFPKHLFDITPKKIEFFAKIEIDKRLLPEKILSQIVDEFYLSLPQFPAEKVRAVMISPDVLVQMIAIDFDYREAMANYEVSEVRLDYLQKLTHQMVEAADKLEELVEAYSDRTHGVVLP